MRIMINDCTVCMAKAERSSLIRRKEEEDHRLFTLCRVLVGLACVCLRVRETCLLLSVCTCAFVYLNGLCALPGVGTDASMS